MNLFFFRFVFRIAGVIAPPRPPRDAVVDPRIPREIPDAMRLGFGLSARGFGFWCFDFVFFSVYCLPIRTRRPRDVVFRKSTIGSTDDFVLTTHPVGSKGEDYRRCPR